MHPFTAVAATAMLAVSVNGAINVGGNWYNNAVDTIQYTNFAFSGTYQKVSSMDNETGVCTSSSQGFSGSLAPLDKEMSIHIRGPFALKQFAFYSPGSSSSKSKRSRHNHKRHGHAHFHAREEEKRAVGDMVTAVIDGQVQTWVNEYDGGAAPTAAPAPVANIFGGVASVVSAAAAAVTSAATPFKSSANGAWVRSAYYDSSSQSAQGVTFLNHKGGQGSGVFDYTFGNSLSYASADGLSGAASPQILQDTVLPSNNELVLMTDAACTDNNPCDYSRPNTVAYHGFNGAQKIFLFEFAMPSDGTTGFNADMPALWSLNAAIPRTLQYGNAACSCWSTGCGELDIMEVLASGDMRAKSTLHSTVSGGDSDYFNRPTGAPIKLALVMSDSTATIKILDSSFDFSNTLSNSDFQSLASTESLGGLAASLFALASS